VKRDAPAAKCGQAPSSHALPASFLKRRDARLRPSQDQRMNVVRAFIGVHHFQVHHVTDHAELVRNSIAAQHVARHAQAGYGDAFC
jgi:hypothetical protein